MIGKLLLITTLMLLSGYFVPYSSRLFFLFTVILLAMFIIFNKKIIISKRITSFYMVLLIFPYLWGVLNSKDVYHHEMNELMFIIVFLLYSFLFVSIVRAKYDYQVYIALLTKYIYLLGIVLSVFGLLKFFLMLNGYQIPFLFEGFQYPMGSSLILDYNFFTMTIIVAFYIGTQYYYQSTSFFQSLMIHFINILFLVTIVFSGSRRGLVITILIILYNAITKSITKFSFKRFLATLFFLFFIVTTFVTMGKKLGVDIDSKDFNQAFYRYEYLLNPSSKVQQRTDRWEYGINLISEKPQYLLFGYHGFEYLHLYTRFSHIKVAEDYPHNILVSSILYGGIYGLVAIILYIIFIYIFYFKIKNIYKYINVIGFYFTLSTIIGISSGSSVFAIRMMLGSSFLIIVGYILYLKGKKECRQIV